MLRTPRNLARKGPPSPRTEAERTLSMTAESEFQRLVLSYDFDARIGVKSGRLMVGPADDDGAIADRKTSREVALAVLKQQATLAGIEGLPARLDAICELVDLKLQELEAEQ